MKNNVHKLLKNMLVCVFICVFALTMSTPAPLHAQMAVNPVAQVVVTNPMGLVKKLIHIGVSVKSLVAQGLSYYRQYEQLQAQLKNLKSMDINSFSDLALAFKRMSKLIEDAQMFGKTILYLVENWDDLYGPAFDMSGDIFSKDFDLINALTQTSLKGAMKGAGETLDAFAVLSRELDELDRLSKTSTGNLQASQIQSQMTSVLGRQQLLITAQTIRDAQWRKNLEMKRANARKASRKRQLNLLGGGMGTHKPKVKAVQLVEFP